METITLQVNNEKAYKLIEDLEALNIVKVLKKVTGYSNTKLSQRFAGSLNLTDEQYKEFQEEIKNGREEWERNI